MSFTFDSGLSGSVFDQAGLGAIAAIPFPLSISGEKFTLSSFPLSVSDDGFSFASLLSDVGLTFTSGFSSVFSTGLGDAVLTFAPPTLSDLSAIGVAGGVGVSDLSKESTFCSGALLALLGTGLLGGVLNSSSFPAEDSDDSDQ